MKRLFNFLFILILTFAAVYLLGPRPNFPALDFEIAPMQKELQEIEQFVIDKNGNIPNIKPNNESKIIWTDSTKQKTEWAIVYLHGFSASPKEGDPVHINFAAKYGMNMYTPLLAQHGIDDKESFHTLTPKMLIDDAKEAIAIGNLIGEKVIVMSCSTGGTLSIPLCAENPELIDALIMYSPNFELFDPKGKMLSGPWGLQIAKKVAGSNYRKVPLPPSCHDYWTMEYRLEGLVALQSLIDETMKEEYFKKIDDPIYAAYYYMSEEQQDKTISVSAIQSYLSLVTTPKEMVEVESLPTTKAHVMTSALQSKDIPTVMRELENFATKVLKLTPKD